ncbi:hypothetical protein KC711_06150 [Candidatus Peregrinibacteria bacterium]|nr:hypothetical protein [Candidatus Peregrinibacteria bacterium]MCB9804673.1 hypothetical protein [Candidatus Peribacteria bacterium]
MIGLSSFIFGTYSLLSLRDENTYEQRSSVSLIAKYSFGVSHLLLAPLGYVLEEIPPVERTGKNFLAILRIAHNGGILLRE